MQEVELTDEEWRRLKELLRTRQDSRYYRRLLGLSWLDAGRTVSEVASLLSASRQSVYAWIEAWQGRRCWEDLRDAPRSGRPPDWDGSLDGLLESCLRQRPRELGYTALNWTVPLLIRHCFQQSGHLFSATTVRRALQRNDFAWKRPRYDLTPDPELEKKNSNSAPREAIGATLGCAL